MDLQLPVQSVSITTKVVSSIPVHGEVYSIQHSVIKINLDFSYELPKKCKWKQCKLDSKMHYLGKCIRIFKYYLCICKLKDILPNMNAGLQSQALVSFKKYMPPPLPYFKVNIYPFLLPHFASIFSPYL